MARSGRRRSDRVRSASGLTVVAATTPPSDDRPAVHAHGVHHVGITVRDLDAAVAFYRDAFEGEQLFSVDQSGELLATTIGVDCQLRMVFMRIGDAFLELLCYSVPKGTAQRVEPYDPGAVHIALRVDDLVESCRRLLLRGVSVSEPAWVQEGPTAGAGFAYCRDPDGVIIELYQTTEGLEERRSI